MTGSANTTEKKHDIPWGSFTPQQLASELTAGLKLFNEQFAAQFRVKIPSGVLPRIDEIRDTYLPYLRDGEYKSNIAYLLHLIKYQLWHHNVFEIRYSLENAFFYQNMVILGITAEALAHAMLLNPCVEPNTADRSKGEITDPYKELHKKVSNQSFAANIDMLASLGAIDMTLRQRYHDLRTGMRNYVHIQSWEGRIYQTVTSSFFQEKLSEFMAFLKDLRDKVNLNFSAEQLKETFEGLNTIYYGDIIQYNNEKGFGFIQSPSFNDNIFFHISNYHGEPAIGIPVMFKVQKGQKGLSAINTKSTHE